MRCESALAVALIVLAPGHAARAADPATLRDYLIQQVCLDGAGAVVAGVSPVDADRRCLGQRALRPGENLPYHKHDHPGFAERALVPRGYQRHDSYPVMTARFGAVVEQSFDFGVGEGRRFGVFDEGLGDGGDIDLIEGDVASIAATEDAGAGFQLFAGLRCTGAVDAAALAQSWIIARQPIAGDTVARLADLRSGAQAVCPVRLNEAFTRWYVRPVAYRAAPGQGRPITLTTLISEHFGGADPATAGHAERFYFTRELGSTRWERWQSTAPRGGLFGTAWFGSAPPAHEAAEAFAATGRCSETPRPAGGAPLVMVDCREWTRIVPPDQPGGDRAGFFIEAVRARGLAGGLFAAAPDAKPQLGFK